MGYINQTAIDTYSMTAVGKSILEQNEEFNDGYVNLENKMKMDYEHVTELGELLDTGTIMEINKQFYKNDEVAYESEPGTFQESKTPETAVLSVWLWDFPDLSHFQISLHT